MMSLEIRVELELTIHAIIPAATRLSTACLVDWLRSIATRRQSFDVLFGSCSYCSEPVAVKINSVKKESTSSSPTNQRFGDALSFPECSSNVMKFSPEEHKFWINIPSKFCSSVEM